MKNRFYISKTALLILLFVFNGSVFSQTYTSAYYIEFTKIPLLKFVAVGDNVTINGTLKNSSGVGIANYQIGVDDGLEGMCRLGPTTDINGKFSYPTSAKYAGVAEIAFILPSGKKQAIYLNVSELVTQFRNMVSGFRNLNIHNDTENDRGVTILVDNVEKQAIVKPGQTIQAIVTENSIDHFPFQVEYESGVGIGIGLVDLSTTKSTDGTINMSMAVGELLLRGSVPNLRRRLWWMLCTRY